ncbi:glycerophosphocholine cholinephosphodiesterase ENPP6-like isoform X2 [Haemaphysalis longicornis]
MAKVGVAKLVLAPHVVSAFLLILLWSQEVARSMPPEQWDFSVGSDKRGSSGGYGTAFRKKLVVFLVDGLRWDYVDRGDYPGFREIAAQGVKADRLVPVFPSVSYPNWYSLATGLYTEDHGIVGNYMYDPARQSYFRMAAPESFQPHWWNRAEPLWTRALRRNRTVAMFWWDGCQVDINGTRPQSCIPYGGYSTKIDYQMDQKILETVEGFKRDSLDLAMLYYEGPDAEGHRDGPQSYGIQTTVGKVDHYLRLLQKSLEQEGLLNQVNIVVVSDHGMTRTSPDSTRHIDMDSLVNDQDVHVMLDKGPFAMLFPKPGREQEVLKSLFFHKTQGLRVFTKETIPEEWHFKNSDRVAPIVLVADEGYYIMPFSNPTKTLPGNNGPSPGVHGYDPRMSDMWGIFYARGPAIRPGVKGTTVMRMVDVYNVMCYALGMEPGPNYDHYLFSHLQRAKRAAPRSEENRA